MKQCKKIIGLLLFLGIAGVMLFSSKSNAQISKTKQHAMYRGLIKKYDSHMRKLYVKQDTDSVYAMYTYYAFVDIDKNGIDECIMRFVGDNKCNTADIYSFGETTCIYSIVKGKLKPVIKMPKFYPYMCHTEYCTIYKKSNYIDRGFSHGYEDRMFYAYKNGKLAKLATSFIAPTYSNETNYQINNNIVTRSYYKKKLKAKIGNGKGYPMKRFKSSITLKYIKLNRKNVKLAVGKSYKLKVKHTKVKVKWSSKNKKIATVTSKGVVKAKKPGSTIIVAKVKNKKLKCKVTVRKVKIVSYGNGSYVPGSYIEYMADKSVEYSPADNEFRVFFSLQLKDGKTRVATDGKIMININNDKKQSVYDDTIEFSKKDFGEWTWRYSGTKYVCCIRIPVSKIQKGLSKKGTLDFKVYINNGVVGELNGGKHTLNNLPEVFDDNFDRIVSYVKERGEFSAFGDYCTYFEVSVSMKENTIEFFENHDRKGNSVKITKGKKTALATVGTHTAEFDISTYKGDASDNLNWSGDVSSSDKIMYNTLIANVLKNISNDYSINAYGSSLQGIGFVEYMFKKW